MIASTAITTSLILASLSTGWYPTGFRWNTGEFPIPYCIVTNATRTSLSQAQQRAELELAVSQWVTSAAGGASPCGYQAAPASYSCNPVVSLNDNKNNIFFESANWQFGSQTLGVTHLGGFGSCGSVGSPSGNVSLTCFSNPDIELNDANVTWRNNGSSTDIASIASHEYGHFVGMGHCNENGTCNAGQAIMYAAYTGGRWYTPSSDDTTGACALYPPTAPGAVGYPCSNNGSCNSSICVTGGGAGYCTQTCGTCPQGYACGPNPNNASQQVCVRDDGTNKGLCETCRPGAPNACNSNGFCGFVGLPENDVARCVVPCPNPNAPDGACPTNYGCFSTQQGSYCFPKSSDCTNLTNFTEIPFGGVCDGTTGCANNGTCIGICSQACSGGPGQGNCPSGYACETFQFQSGPEAYCAPPAAEGESCAGLRACPTGPCLTTQAGGDPLCYQDCAGNPGACNNAQTCQTYSLQGGGTVALCEPPGVPPNPPDAGVPDSGTGPGPDSGTGPGPDGGVGPGPDGGNEPGPDGGGPVIPGLCQCDTDFCCSPDCNCDPECACQCDQTTACDPDCECDPECQVGCPGFRDPNAKQTGSDCTCVALNPAPSPVWIGWSVLLLLGLSRRRRMR